MGFEVVWVAATLDPITTTEGVLVIPHSTFDNCPSLQIVFVPGGGSKGVSAAMLDPLL